MLYKVEAMADDQDLDYTQRAELRQRLAYPILVAFEKWVLNYLPKAIPNGRMHRALRYTYNLFQRLSRYHLDGRYKPDNNHVENAIRPLLDISEMLTPRFGHAAPPEVFIQRTD